MDHAQITAALAAMPEEHKEILAKIGDGNIAKGLTNLIGVISNNLPAIIQIITTLGPAFGLPKV